MKPGETSSVFALGMLGASLCIFVGSWIFEGIVSTSTFDLWEWWSNIFKNIMPQYQESSGRVIAFLVFMVIVSCLISLFFVARNHFRKVK